ncbi:type II toxin-antitoxin system HicB family antitoxin [Synechocystis sp. B12]|nr:type II toxin-antitoxin system HicB family antitoxin [Synechocystis sp. B12]
MGDLGGRIRLHKQVLSLYYYELIKGVKSMKIRVIIEWDSESQSYSATCPELNYISSFGDTKEVAIINLRDAIQLMLEPIPDEFLVSNSSQEIVELAL